MLVKLGRTLWGFSLLVMGVVLMFLPGPGLTTFISGLVILSKNFRWAKRATRALQRYLLRIVAVLDTYVQ